MQGVDDDEDMELEAEEVAEGRGVKKMLDPRLPSELEVKEHQLTHLPYRNWCHHCVRGRGKEADHRRQGKEERGVDEFHMDYCFPGDGLGFKLTVLVVVERYSSMKLAVVVPTKGTSGMYRPESCGVCAGVWRS